jgi:hypothetical protein
VRHTETNDQKTQAQNKLEAPKALAAVAGNA